jgi:Hypothetical protein (DUF2513)
MKRDWDLLRYILGKIESSEAGNLMTFSSDAYPIPSKIEQNYESQEIMCQAIMEYVLLLNDEHLIDLCNMSRNSSGSLTNIHIYRLTALGHDFLELSRKENDWNIVTDKLKKSGGSMTMAIITQLLIALGRQQLHL